MTELPAQLFTLLLDINSAGQRHDELAAVAQNRVRGRFRLGNTGTDLRASQLREQPCTVGEERWIGLASKKKFQRLPGWDCVIGSNLTDRANRFAHEVETGYRLFLVRRPRVR